MATGDWQTLAADSATPNTPLRAVNLDAQTMALAAAIAAVPVPLAPVSADWTGITSEFIPVTGAASAQLEIVYRSDLGQHARLAAGRLPDLDSVTVNHTVPLGTPGESSASGGAFQVAVTTATAARFGLHVGSRLIAPDDLAFVVTAIISPMTPGSAFWTLDPVLAAPALGSAGAWLGAVFVGPDEAGDLQYAFGSPGMKVFWDFPMALANVSATAAGQLAVHLNAAADQDLAGASVVGSGTLNPVRGRPTR